ncbi:MAG: hypothetical protein V1845_01870 [bacterium]
MTPQIPIKINTNAKQSQQDIKKALNLNQVISDHEQAIRPKPKKRFWPILAALLFFIAAALAFKIFWLDRQNQFLQLSRLVPETSQASMVVRLADVASAAKPLAYQVGKGEWYEWLSGRTIQFLKDSNISAQKDLLPLFNDQALVLLFAPVSGKNDVSWGLIAQIKQGQEPINQPLLVKMQDEIKNSFGLNQQLYRQIQINSAFSFKQMDRPYYWTQINNLVLISNSLPAMQKMVDKVISN